MTIARRLILLLAVPFLILFGIWVVTRMQMSREWMGLADQAMALAAAGRKDEANATLFGLMAKIGDSLSVVTLRINHGESREVDFA
jgi:hypothetical protein